MSTPPAGAPMAEENCTRNPREICRRPASSSQGTRNMICGAGGGGRHGMAGAGPAFRVPFPPAAACGRQPGAVPMQAQGPTCRSGSQSCSNAASSSGRRSKTGASERATSLTAGGGGFRGQEGAGFSFCRCHRQAAAPQHAEGTTPPPGAWPAVACHACAAPLPKRRARLPPETRAAGRRGHTRARAPPAAPRAPPPPATRPAAAPARGAGWQAAAGQGTAGRAGRRRAGARPERGRRELQAGGGAATVRGSRVAAPHAARLASSAGEQATRDGTRLRDRPLSHSPER